MNPLDPSRDYWDRHARRDPLWAILSDNNRGNRGWDLPSFMESGEREISLLDNELQRLRIDVRRERALDFGCGVGRLTQPLARRFDHVVGVDISPAMIELARRLNRFSERAQYRLNEPDLLTALRGLHFDFIYSNIVLQHVPPDAARAYLRDFLTLLKPQGILVVQLPAHRSDPAAHAPVPMPPPAYSAALSFAYPPPASLPLSALATIAIELRNVTDVAWTATEYGSIRVGNHWLDARGAMQIQDDGRVPVPATVGADQMCVLELQVQAPDAPARYTLEIDVVHEGITWFADRGSRTLRTTVAVGDATETAASDTPTGPAAPEYSEQELTAMLPPLDEEQPLESFPMHGIEKQEVIDLLHRAGGVVLHAIDDDRARPEWAGYKYFVRKS